MGKYDSLARFLKRQKGAAVELSFTEIERRLGALLPKAANTAEWWRAEGAQTRSWEPLGFVATLEPGSEQVRFDRASALRRKPKGEEGRGRALRFESVLARRPSCPIPLSSLSSLSFRPRSVLDLAVSRRLMRRRPRPGGRLQPRRRRSMTTLRSFATSWPGACVQSVAPRPS